MAQHLCHAIDCNIRVPANRLMCAPHWFMVPRILRTEVWRTYRPGQERDKSPSRAYLDAAREAINVVAMAEGKPLLSDTSEIVKTLEALIAKEKDR